MPTNLIQDGSVLTLTAPSGGVVNGTPIQIGELLVIPLNTVAENLPFDGRIDGVWTLPKATGQTWSEGALLYWDDGNGVFTTAETEGFQRAGAAVAAAGSGDTTGRVRLDGVALGEPVPGA